jgi:VanZ family protein
LAILSSLSHPGPKIDVVGIDKVEHAIYFAVGGMCLALALALRGKTAHSALLTAPWRKLALITLLAGAAVGWFDEWHQSFTPGRKGLDVYDWMADVLGSLAAVPLARLGLRWLALRGGRA